MAKQLFIEDPAPKPTDILPHMNSQKSFFSTDIYQSGTELSNASTTNVEGDN